MAASAPTASAVSRRSGMTSARATCWTPRSLSQMVVPRPIGPAPNTTTSGVPAALRLRLFDDGSHLPE